MLLITQAPWWDLPTQSLAIWMGAFAFLSFSMIYWLLQAMPWSWIMIRSFYTVWALVSIFLALQSRATSLAFFSLVLIALSWIYVSWLKREFKRSYLNPKCKWYQGTPEFIPSLKVKAEVNSLNADSAIPMECSVSHIDREGAYIFVSHENTSLQSLHRVSQIKISRPGRELVLPVQVISLLARARGVGVRFCLDQMNADAKKHLFDFLYSLEGEGFCENR